MPELHGFWPEQEVGGHEPPIQMAENGPSEIPEYGIAAGTPQYMPTPEFYQYGPVQEVNGYKPPIQMAENGPSEIPQYGISAGTPQYMPAPGFYQYGPVQDVGGYASFIPLFKNRPSSWSKEIQMTDESNNASSAQVPTYRSSSVAFEIEPSTEVLVCEPISENIAETPLFSGSMECLPYHNKVFDSSTDVEDNSQTTSSHLDQDNAGNFTEHTRITEIIEPEIFSNRNRERKIDEISEISYISDDEGFSSNNVYEHENEDFDYSTEQFTETVDDIYIHRPLKWAFINLERFSLVNEIIYEEDEFEFENASSEDDDSIHADSEIENSEHSNDIVFDSINEIQQMNVESDGSSISSTKDDVEEENFVIYRNTTSLQVIQCTKSEGEKVYDDKQKQKQKFHYLTGCEDSKNEDDRSLSKDETIEEYEKETTSCMDIFWHFLRKFTSVVCPCLKRRK
ncbi:uncharacterized protein LOC111634865 [Centruroides sculpturatus]|uniref:uncharacterized protein LOC111634865 n=1 Tax=Centruroides sculpturatus TaxID=218467 RepID=UPI000C6ED694|nr:uncharacterized protein LOC111634865 [Centruroides sculpturatus]